MHRQWFGDAYTYAHRALIHGITSPGEWFVHPIVNGGDMLGHWGGVKLYHLNQSQGRNYILQRWQRRGSFHHQRVGSGL